MPAAGNWYGKAFANLLGGEIAGDTFAIDYLSDTMKCLLTTNVYAPNLDTHETKADITNEVSGTGYTARGATLGTKTLTFTAANSWATQWAVATVYAVGDIVRPTAGNGRLYRCIVAGTSHASVQPTWPTVSGQTVVDNTVTWAEIGRGLIQIDAADPSWPSSTITARYAVIYKDTGVDATSPLLFLLDLGGDIASTNGTFTTLLASLGIAVISAP